MSNFIDHVFIEIRSGDGGNGIVAWRREKYEPMGGPAGGNGGRGGHVFIEATSDLNTLIDFRYKKKFEAMNGARGRPKGMHGKDADDLVVRVPVGTLVRDDQSHEVIADLVENGQRVLVAEGGRGGHGNSMLATPTRRAPHFCEPGQSGIVRNLELELKVLADVGIIGLPNAGKSTLISKISNARPKIADYPFSTLTPNLGTVKTASSNSFVVADIPGLVEGASQGVGLGHEFLRHIERTRILIHLVDISLEEPEKAIATINNELKLHKAGLEDLPQCLVLNKADLLDPEDAEKTSGAIEEFKKVSDKNRRLDPSPAFSKIHVISAYTGKGVKELLQTIEAALSSLKLKSPQAVTSYFDPAASERPVESFNVARRKNVFYISGDRVERLIAVTNMRDPESLHHMYKVLKSMGVIDALIKEGARSGSEVVAGRTTFSFGDQI